MTTVQPTMEQTAARLAWNATAVDFLGNTPLLKLSEAITQADADVFVKLEEYNPGGSIKSRVALSMVMEAERSGVLRPGTGQVIAEPTGGNTGMGLAVVGSIRGYKVVLVMPDNFSPEKQMALRLYGAEVLLSDSTTGNDSHIKAMPSILEEFPGAVWLNQFENPGNPAAHYNGTAPEILAALPRVDAFVAGVGSGGTITGVGKRLKEANGKTVICAVQPEGCDILKGKAVPHRIQAIALGTIPPVFDPGVVDQVEDVAYEQVLECLRALATQAGLLLGLSSGANILGACRLARRMPTGATVVTVAPDSGRSYMDNFSQGAAPNGQ